MASVTIIEVAERAGVSIKTVSRVLNREPNVREETRERVMAAVQALDYQPSLSARSLAGARSFLIGLLFDNPSASYVSDIQLGAVSRCRESGYHLTIEPVDAASPDLERVVRQIVSTLRLDGVILTPPVCDDARVLDVLEKSGTPYVRVAPDRQPDRAARVGMDDWRAAFEMTRRLIELGHKDIGFIQGHPNHGASHLRHEGYLAALSSHSLTPRPGRVKQGWFDFQSGFACAQELLANPDDRPSAIFASNDDMALGVMAAANRLRIGVPDQLSIAGFDDTPAALTVWPQLTTVAQPIFQMAAAACDLIISGEAREGAAPARLLDFKVIERGSTAARA
ncbi:LacI family DNA-binding transcriptional regulator [Caulobacter sp. 17J80-11]|uniref:LacI family DNA-binding transcriptional regulator n=1 Tax=Caulobacter sp. 17J80-11 TaxID=2763502 RepID=UPI0016534A9C|nr:LacI family DNA-binding transcriptional regulator [Caulobacter sp. 17J80-11]